MLARACFRMPFLTDILVHNNLSNHQHHLTILTVFCQHSLWFAASWCQIIVAGRRTKLKYCSTIRGWHTTHQREDRMDSKQSTEALSVVSSDTIAYLSFDFLKQIATLALATAGGSVTLLQTVLANSPSRPFMMLACGLLVLSALCSLQAQQILVERLRVSGDHDVSAFSRKLKLPRTAKTERAITIVSFSMFGAGLGLAIYALVS